MSFSRILKKKQILKKHLQLLLWQIRIHTNHQNSDEKFFIKIGFNIEKTYIWSTKILIITINF